VPLSTYQQMLRLLSADLKRDYPGLTLQQVLDMDTPTES